MVFEKSKARAGFPNSLLILGFTNFIFAQAPPVQWLWSQGGTGDDFVNGVVETSDSNYVFSGTTTSTDGDVAANNGGRDAWIYKVKKDSGTIIWSHNFGGNSNDQIWRAMQTSNNELAGIGVTSSATLPSFHSVVDLYLLKMDAMGTLQWQKSYGGSGTDWGDNMVQATNGNFIACGKTNTNNNGDLAGIPYNGGVSDLWVAEIDTGGTHNIVAGRNKCFGGSLVEDFASIANTSDGGYIVSCRTNSSDGMVLGNHGGYDSWVLKLDASLTVRWSKCYGERATTSFGMFSRTRTETLS